MTRVPPSSRYTLVSDIASSFDSGDRAMARKIRRVTGSRAAAVTLANNQPSPYWLSTNSPEGPDEGLGPIASNRPSDVVARSGEPANTLTMQQY